MNDIIYLEPEDVLYLHDLALEKDGGIAGRDAGRLEAKLAIPMAGFGDHDEYPSLVEKAAAYIYFLASGHCFNDANKRTAYASAFTFLDWNGFDLIVNDEEVERFMILVGNHKSRPPFVVAVCWIATYMHEQETNE